MPLFLIPVLGTLTSLAGQLIGKPGGNETVSHYATLVSGLLSRALSAGIDISAELKVILIEMQTFVAEGRAATNDEMRASNQRLKDGIAPALAHDVSTHPPLSGGD